MLYGIAAAYYAVRREEGLGMGDVKMLAMIGAFTGVEGSSRHTGAVVVLRSGHRRRPHQRATRRA